MTNPIINYDRQGSSPEQSERMELAAVRSRVEDCRALVRHLERITGEYRASIRRQPHLRAALMDRPEWAQLAEARDALADARDKLVSLEEV